LNLDHAIVITRSP